VLVVPWAPQLAVLAHPAVHLFVTHGGLTSMHEGLVAGKPLLVTPFFADQPGALGIRREARTN
jgi:anthocyanidin 3-O-glucosyltransferase